MKLNVLQGEKGRETVMKRREKPGIPKFIEKQPTEKKENVFI